MTTSNEETILEVPELSPEERAREAAESRLRIDAAFQAFVSEEKSERDDQPLYVSADTIRKRKAAAARIRSQRTAIERREKRRKQILANREIPVFHGLWD
ncbi:hypothetical protein [Methylosinus sp. PW1]|uniref:hypothetical protein n=1 Tax=Methylosinus sp. PW1 TaxID=107636 RepID=UPI0005675461|nr:hypothetical protein [Methylosinus sp. PW1]